MAHGYVLCRKCDVRFKKNDGVCPNCGKKYRTPLHKQWWFVLLYWVSFAFFVLFNLSRCAACLGLQNQEVKNPWGELILSEMLPEPPLVVEKVISNRADKMEVQFDEMDALEFGNYVEACRNKGFTEFASVRDDSFEAYSQEGHHLKIDVSVIRTELTLTRAAEPRQQWPETGLAAMLPAPRALKIEVQTNTDENLDATLELITKEAYADFVAGCKEAGFVEGSSQREGFYSAYNAEGYHLELRYNEYRNSVDVNMSDPMKMSVLAWPTTGPARQLPAPSQKQGFVSYDREDAFIVYVADVSPQGYEAYVKKCEQKGFTADHQRYETSYQAKNKAGYELYVSYEHGERMLIRIDAPEPEETATPKPTNTPKPTATPKLTEAPKTSETLVDGMRPEFKKAMDAYEEFFDSYVAMMKKLEKSPNDPLLLLEYAKMTAQYADSMKALEDWENKELNSKEMNYYIAVTNRINKKLLEVAQ